MFVFVPFALCTPFVHIIFFMSYYLARKGLSLQSHIWICYLRSISHCLILIHAPCLFGKYVEWIRHVFTTWRFSVFFARKHYSRSRSMKHEVTSMHLTMLDEKNGKPSDFMHLLREKNGVHNCSNSVQFKFNGSEPLPPRISPNLPRSLSLSRWAQSHDFMRSREFPKKTANTMWNQNTSARSASSFDAVAVMMCHYLMDYCHTQCSFPHFIDFNGWLKPAAVCGLYGEYIYVHQGYISLLRASHFV